MSKRKKGPYFSYVDEESLGASPYNPVIPDKIVSTPLIRQLITELSAQSNDSPQTDRVQTLFEELKSSTIDFVLVSQTDTKIVYRHPEHSNQYVEYRKNSKGHWEIFPDPGVDCIIPDAARGQLIIVNNGQPQFYGKGPFPKIHSDSIRTVPFYSQSSSINPREHDSDDGFDPIPDAKTNPLLTGAISAQPDLSTVKFPELNIGEICTQVHSEALRRIEKQFSPHFVAVYRIPPDKQAEFKKTMLKLQHTQCPKTFSMDMARAIGMLTKNDAILPPALGCLPHAEGQNWFSWFQANENHVLGMKLSQGENLELLVPQALNQEEYAVFSFHKNHSLSPGEVLHIAKGGSTQLATRSHFPDGAPRLSTQLHILNENQERLHLEASRAEVNRYIEIGLPKESHQAPIRPVKSSQIYSPTHQENSGDASFSERIKFEREKSASILGLPDNIKISPSSRYALHCSFKDDQCWGNKFDYNSATVYVLQKRGVTLAGDDLSGTLIIEVAGNPGDADYTIRMRCGFKAEGKDEVSHVDAAVTVVHKGKEFTATVKDKEITFDKTAEATPFKKNCWPQIMCISGCCGNYRKINRQNIMKPGSDLQRNL